RQRRRNRVHLRFFSRIRQHQRRLPLLISRSRASVRATGAGAYRSARMSTVNTDNPDLPQLMRQASRVLAQLEAWLPPAPPANDAAATAYRWRRRGQRGFLDPVRHVAQIRLDDLQHVERQKAVIERNTRQFLAGRPANNVLMTGARGTGKSSLVKA